MRIDQRIGDAFELDIDDPNGFPNLHRADAAAKPVRGLEMVQSVAQVAQYAKGIGGAGNRLRNCAQKRIAEFQDLPGGHVSPSYQAPMVR